ncbi:energy-coupling factor ABC transporter ATP-binding protein [Candidatus Syntrophocurvum alkaliphilum]|uniref:energy-coupling factor ABC transporter ATP-binding protein n=1 Tax=Candidatus Syntrophocurvum alkaliphilum TaxID=2293317 RepID=UPI00168C91DD|nr:ABC transporter ATP-binding protein [Candidatus Syntrophocurvum alkaliphilum]
MKTVEINKLTFKYPDQTIGIKDLNLEINSAKRVAILGSNGSGKTTLLFHLCGIFIPQKGKVKVLNEEVNKSNLRKIREKVGFVFDHPDYQLFSTSVYNDIAFGPINLGLDEKTIKKRVQKAMKLVNIEDLAAKSPSRLSWGQKKRVAIAGVLAMNPSLIIFDEPLSGLDPASMQSFTTILNQVYDQGKTVFISTHDVDFAYS